MNACEKILLYAHGELTPNEQTAMREHVQTCASCRQQLAFLEQLDQALAAPAAPATLVDKLFARTTRKKTVFFTWKKVLATSFSVLIAVIAGVELLRTPDTTFSDQELVAFAQANMENDYQTFEYDLEELEYF